jgi:heterotetrameric sarcosine oxidase gamma subunit
LLLQYHAWPEAYPRVAAALAASCGASGAPAPGKAVSGGDVSLLRIHPQRLWLISEYPAADRYPALDSEAGASLDLSHARAIFRVAEEFAVPLLSRFIAIDLRPHHFAVDDVAVTPLHRVSVVLWRRADGIDVLVPRSFARSIWELLAETAGRLD